MCGEWGTWSPPPKGGGGGVTHLFPIAGGGLGKGAPRAERLFLQSVQAKEEGYCTSHSDACVCSHALYVAFDWQHGTRCLPHLSNPWP